MNATQRLFVFTLMAALLMGCTSTRVVDPSQPAPYAEINERAQDKPAQLQLAGGRAIQARRLHVMPDSSSYVGTDNQLHSIATSRIRTVAFTYWKKGALRGIGIGLLAGSVLAALVGSSANDNCNEDEWFCGIAFTASDYGSVIGLGGVIGLFIGAGRGSRTVYRFVPDKPLATDSQSTRAIRRRAPE